MDPKYLRIQLRALGVVHTALHKGKCQIIDYTVQYATLVTKLSLASH